MIVNKGDGYAVFPLNHHYLYSIMLCLQSGKLALKEMDFNP